MTKYLADVLTFFDGELLTAQFCRLPVIQLLYTGLVNNPAPSIAVRDPKKFPSLRGWES